jgi:Cdc6-like AAA superfamily ATPase
LAKSIEHNIFPELTPRAELFEKVGLIEKAWLDQSSLGFPDNLVPLVNGLTFFRIKGVQALFEEKDDRLKAIGLPANLFAAMYNQAFPLVYVIQCRKSRIKVFLATNNSGSPCLSSLLESFLGLTLYETDTPANQWDMPGYAHCAALTGIPSYSVRGKLNKEQSTENPGIDHLILGLMREEWCYVVQAFPIRREQTSLWLESCAREIKDTNESFLLRDIQKSNRMASYYVEILEKSMNRLKWGKQQGLWQTGVYLFSKEPDSASQSAAILLSIFSGDRSTPEPIRCQTCMRSGNISPFVNCYNSKELKAFFSLPSREFPGFRLHEQSLFDVDFASNTEKSILIGQIMVNNQTYDYPASVSVDELTKHALVAGVTGSGKTNTIFNLLKDVYVSHQVPFLVIEPAKSEYRNLLQEISSLLVFTLGEEKPGISSPFRLNPFAFPDGVSLQTHIDYLKAVFNASFVMYAPMPYVLEECLYKIYEDKGWNLVTSTNFRGRTEASFPTLTDLYLKIDEVVENIGYQDRTTMDIKAALKTRIKNLCLGGKGMMLNTTSIISFDEIMARPTVLELKYLGNDEEKAFMMGLILMAVWEHYEFLQGRGQNITDGLKHLTIIEEAHRLLKNVPTEKTSEEQSNIKGKGVETFCNLLAEIRAYGEGVLVSEQIPAKLAPDVIKNSNLKIMHRMVAKEDRGLMGDTMNLDLHQKRQAVCLEVGEAIFFLRRLGPLSKGQNPAIRSQKSKRNF